MSYETYLDQKPTSGGMLLSSDSAWNTYLNGLKATGELFDEGWSDHYPANTGAVPVVATKAFTSRTWTNSLSITKPSSIASGDLLVIFTAHSSADTISISGFTQRNQAVSSDGSDTLTITAFEKIATGSEPGSYTASVSGTTDVSAAAFRITGAHSSPYVDSAVWESDAYSLNRRLPSVNTTAGNCLLIAWHQTWYDTNDHSPSGWTAQYTDQSDGYGYTKTAASAGATGNTNFNDSSAYALTGSVVLAYKPTPPADGYSIVDTTTSIEDDSNNPYSLKIITDASTDTFGGGKTISPALDLTSSTTLGAWVRSSDWTHTTDAFLLLCNDTTPTNYYEISLKDLLTSPADDTWYYVTWDIADMTSHGTPDIAAIDYMVAGATSTGVSITVNIGRLTLYPYSNEQLYWKAEVLMADSTDVPEELDDTTIIFSDDFTADPGSDIYYKNGNITQSGSIITIGPWSYIKTLAAYDIKDAEVVLKTDTFPTGNLDLSFFGLMPSHRGFLQIYRTSGALGVAYQTPDTDYTINNYSTSTDKYWRFSHSGNTVTFSRSSDGSSWTTITSFTTDNLPPMRWYMTYEDTDSSWKIDKLTVQQRSTSYGTVWTGGQWYDMTDDVTGVKISRTYSNRPDTGTAIMTIDNSDRQYSVWAQATDALGGNPQYFAPGTLVRVGVYGTSVWFPTFTGIVSDWTEKTAALEKYSYIELKFYQPTGTLAGIEDTELETAVGDNEMIAERIDRILTYTGWQYGYEDVSGEDTAYRFQATKHSGNRLGECYLTADSKGATFRSSRRGKAFTYWLDSPWLTNDPDTNPDDQGSVMPDKTTIYLADYYQEPDSDEPNSIYVPYVADSLIINNDFKYLTNEVIGTPVGGTAATLSDQVSIDKYGVKRTYKRDDLICTTAVDLESVLQRWLVTEVYRPESVQLNAGMHPHVMAFLLQMDVERMVLVKAQDSVIFRTLIAGYEMSIQPLHGNVQWTASLTFRPYSDSAWWRI